MITIDTDALSQKYRDIAIDINRKALSITNYNNSEQEKDLTEPPNCKGFGRIRHFKLKASDNWPLNPLPIVPAKKYLNLNASDEIRAQVFQNSICNWRCWYCYVDFKLLKGDKRFSKFLTCDDLLDLHQNELNPPKLIDLSGGQPDLTPEWVPWMIEAIKKRNLDDKILLWSDDNLSNDFFWKYLSDSQIASIASYKMYARVCCFKGIDETSFTINTKAAPQLFSRQLELFERLLKTGIDLYAYITLTAPSKTNFEKNVPQFLDNIQKINEKFPLRIVPLKIFEFTPSKNRNEFDKPDLLLGQQKAVEIWMKELQSRFTIEELTKPINEISI